MVHKRLEGNIVREYSLTGCTTSVATGRMCSRWVKLREKETRLRTTRITHDKTRKWESVLDKVLKEKDVSNAIKVIY